MSTNKLPWRETQYLKLLLEAGVLRFGEFKTKSGRLSPYFFNTGHFDSGLVLSAVAEIYADLILETFGASVDNLFGPAYKGIPLAIATAQALARKVGHDVSFTFNRKEAKDHGEGGLLVGRQYQGGERVVVIEDVITGGTSINETMPLLKSFQLNLLGFAVGIDRQEFGSGTKSALAEVQDKWKLPVAAVITVRKIVTFLYNHEFIGKIWIDDQLKSQIETYLATYGGTYK